MELEFLIMLFLVLSLSIHSNHVCTLGKRNLPITYYMVVPFVDFQMQVSGALSIVSRRVVVLSLGLISWAFRCAPRLGDTFWEPFAGEVLLGVQKTSYVCCLRQSLSFVV